MGWDDDYAKENFIEGHQPPENGAWLCRNSWGSDYNDFPMNGYRHWGIEQEEHKHNGYFWLSYYDQTIDDPEAFVFDKSNVGSSYYVQQYDYVPADGVKEVFGRDLPENAFRQVGTQHCLRRKAQRLFRGSPGKQHRGSIRNKRRRQF